MQKMHLTLILSFSLMFSHLNACHTQSLHTVFVPGFIDPISMYTAHQAAFALHSTHSKVEFLDEQKPDNVLDQCIFNICAWLGKPNVNRQSCMGQTRDIAYLQEHLSKIDQNIIIFARSKGAAATLGLLADQHYSNIQAIVLECCPSDLLQAVNPKIAPFGIPFDYNEFLWRLAFPNYPKNAIAPIDQIKHIHNKNMPILIITSRSDCTVPFAQSLALYAEFKNQGFDYVHIAIVDSSHCKGIIQDPDTYLTAVHSFYRHYELPYNPDFATKDLNAYQYDLNKALYEIECFNQTLLGQCQRAQQRLLAAFTALCAALMLTYTYCKSHPKPFDPKTLSDTL